jgi:hypothetical protein
LDTILTQIKKDSNLEVKIMLRKYYPSLYFIFGLNYLSKLQKPSAQTFSIEILLFRAKKDHVVWEKWAISNVSGISIILISYLLIVEAYTFFQ